MPIVVCVSAGFAFVMICYIVVKIFHDNLRYHDPAGVAVSLIVIIIIALGIGMIFHSAVKNHIQIVMEDYHRGKIEMVITTTQSNGNLIKQDTTYCYK